MVIFIYNQKSFVRRRLRRCRLRHKIRAIKTRPNNPLRFLQRTNSIRRYLANDLLFRYSQNDVQNTKAFSQQKIPPPKSKDQPLESERAHFYVRFNNGSLAMHRQTFIFLLPRQIATVQQKTTKTNNHINQPEQSITITTTSDNSKINHRKQSHNIRNKQSLFLSY